MAARIEVEKLGPEEFRVRVIEGKSETLHVVTMKTSEYERISGKKVAPAELVHRAFEFLLARERKEQILQRFDLTIIGQYFTEFEQAMKRSLKAL
ncbi:MAG TPA: hypothetical protein VNV41_17515 [Candidatus Acidoferrales bacterium]|jgi:hypothetical protein|nr:hypothetical protein [Candidatus Acidoferrales bacterium]